MKLYILFLYTPAIKNWGCVLYATKSFMERKSPSEKTYFSQHPGLSSKITLKLPKHKPYLSIIHSWYWNIILNFKRTLEHIINVFFKIKVNLSSWLSLTVIHKWPKFTTTKSFQQQQHKKAEILIFIFNI